MKYKKFHEVWFKAKHLAKFWQQILFDQLVRIFDDLQEYYYICTSDYIYLSPSEIRFNCDVIPPILYKSEGYEETVLESLNLALLRRKSPDAIARKVAVVHRQGGACYDQNALNNPRKLEGWFAYQGNGQLWVLKTLHNLELVTTIKVRHLKSITEKQWSEVCSDQVLHGGRTLMVEGSSLELLEKEKRAVIKKWKKGLAPVWTHVVSNHSPSKAARLQDYDKTATPKNTHSCAGYGVCHSTKADRSDDESKSDDDHRCQRTFETVARRKTPRYSDFYTEVLDWGLYLRVFFFLSIVLSSVLYTLQKDTSVTTDKQNVD